MSLASEQTSACPLTVGQRMELGYDPSAPLSRASSATEWLSSRLEDLSADGSLLTLAWPTDALRRLILVEPADPVSVAITADQDALYAADALIESTTHVPVPFLTARIVGGWQRTQRRDAVRVGVSITPRLAHKAVGQTSTPLRLGITNLSASGVQVRSHDELQAGDVLRLGFELVGTADRLELQARVRRVYRFETPGSRFSTWDAGCEFEGLSERLGQRIVQYIFAQQRALARATRGHL
jgi:c-di-GMP-binding flagellar brake protein YcgR